MTAARAESVELEAVGLNGKTVPRCHFFLKTLDIAVFEFHDLPAAGADEVIMVAFVRDIVVLGLSAEVPSLCETGFAKKVERAVNGRQPQVRIFTSQLMVHLFRCDVFLLEKGVEDQFTLACKLQLVLPEVLLQDAHFFGMFGHRDQTEPCNSGIKDEIEQLVKSVDHESIPRSSAHL